MASKKSTKSQKKSTKSQIGLRLRFQLVIGGLVVLSAMLLSSLAVVSLIQSNREHTTQLRQASELRYRAEVKHQVQTMVSVLETYMRRGQQQNDPKELREEIKALVREARYDIHGSRSARKGDHRGYFFLYARGGTCMAHGGPPKLRGGTKPWRLAERHNPEVILALEKAAIAGGGFVEYEKNKPADPDARILKIGYAEMIPALGWWVGTGVYTEDMDPPIDAAVHEQEQRLHQRLLRFGLLAAVLLAAAIFLAFVLGAQATRPINRLVREVSLLADDRLETRIAVRSRDELRDLAEAFNTLADRVSEAIRDLELSERFHLKLLESIADGLVVTNRDNEIVQVNPAAERIFNYAPGELIGKQLHVLLPKELQEDYERSTLDEVNRGETVVNYNVRRVRKTGEDVYLTVAVAPLFDEEGEVTLRIHSITDMTQQQTLEERLQKVEQMRNQLLAQDGRRESSPVAAFERRRVTVFYSHLGGLGELSSELEPEEFTTLLSEFLKAMNGIIDQHGGTLDKFLGEGQMGFFGAPQSNGEREDAQSCVRMALEMHTRLDELNRRWTLRAPLRFCVGINTGFVTLGNFGSEYHLDYTVVGIPALVAQRLSQHSSDSGVFVAHDTRRHLSSAFQVGAEESVMLPGVQRAVVVYRIDRVV